MLSSTAGAAEWRGHLLGEYLEAEEEYMGRPYYIQEDTEGAKPRYLYFDDNCWRVSETLGNKNDYIKNCQNAPKPPGRKWEYVADASIVPWNNTDTTLFAEFTSLSPCNLVKVVGAGDVQRKHHPSLGKYRSDCIVLSIIQRQMSTSKQSNMQN